MGEYSICVSDGKVIGDSAFYIFANDALGAECKRLCDFCDATDKNPSEKKSRAAEYKCAKYRYASVSLIHSILQNNNRQRKMKNLEYSHYIMPPFDEIFMARAEYFALYESALPDEKPDYSLYYALSAFTEKELDDLDEKLTNASDWEKIELDERIAGLKFAKVCLDEAWQKRKDAVQ